MIESYQYHKHLFNRCANTFVNIIIILIYVFFLWLDSFDRFLIFASRKSIFWQFCCKKNQKTAHHRYSLRFYHIKNIDNNFSFHLNISNISWNQLKMTNSCEIILINPHPFFHPHLGNFFLHPNMHASG